MNLILFLTGSRTVRAEREQSAALLDLCFRLEIGYTDFCAEEGGGISFRTSSLSAKKLLRHCQSEGIAVTASGDRGLPFLFYRYRRRVGLMLGSVLAVILMVLSSRVVWDIRISGNTTLTDAEVRAELKACGLGLGSYIPSLRTEELENRVLIASDRISWISVYLDGTVARVQIIEHSAPPEEEGRLPANLIAACDGQIETVELYRGNCIVKTGQAVKKGELLVSGLYDSQISGYRYTRAAGNVYARTEKAFRVEIPLSYEEKVYEPSVCSEICLHFFDFSIKIFKRTGNGEGMCDIIEEEKGPELFGLSALPFGITLEKQLPYTVETRTRTPEEATEAAYAALAHELSALSEETKLLKKSVTLTWSETSLILDCTLECIENIAVQSEFEISELP